ncbi:MAG: thiamine diphosphokinase [Lachnospiraceae bacterium]|nr:thiamine diphosphokinase [Lachnospiraceae bacterium]
MNSMIITGGQIDLPFAKTILESQAWDLVISADLGLHFCLEAGVVPDVILGDFDSVEPKDLAYAQEHYPERLFRFPAEKDETDTELAVDCALRAGADRITILGGTGDRMDHVLGNVQMLKKALDAGAVCFLMDPHNRIRMIREDLTMNREAQFGDYVSLIPFTPEVEGLSLTGFVYEVEDLTLQSGTARGISNEIRDEEALISFQNGILLVIESRD